MNKAEYLTEGAIEADFLFTNKVWDTAHDKEENISIHMARAILVLTTKDKKLSILVKTSVFL